MEVSFDGEVWSWRGPAPYHFVTVPGPLSQELRSAAAALSYGWGMVPAEVEIGSTVWTTSLWPKDGGYVVPLKDLVRRAESIEVGDVVRLVLRVGA